MRMKRFAGTRVHSRPTFLDLFKAMHRESSPVAMDTQQNGFGESKPPPSFDFIPLFFQLLENSAGSKSPLQITPPVSKIQSFLDKERNTPIRRGTLKRLLENCSLARRKRSF